jgi:hypothetical protein
MCSIDAAMLWCVKGTSLGAPVVPPVNIRSAMSSPSVTRGSVVAPGAGVPSLCTIRTSAELPDPSSSMVQ